MSMIRKLTNNDHKMFGKLYLDQDNSLWQITISQHSCLNVYLDDKIKLPLSIYVIDVDGYMSSLDDVYISQWTYIS